MKSIGGIIFALLLLVLLPSVSAKVVINEIMYSPLGDDDSLEWIELFNEGTSAVDVSGYKIDGNAFDDATIPTLGFLVVARQLTGNLSFSTVYGNKDGVWNATDPFAAVDGQFVLTNTGKTIMLTDGFGIIVDTVQYDGSLAHENGKTMERTNALNSNFKESSSQGGSPGTANGVFNSAPIIATASPDKTTVLIGEDKELIFSVVVTDQQNNAVLTWRVDGSTKTTGDRFIFNASQFTLGEHSVYLTASDGEFSLTRSWNVTVSDVPLSRAMNISYNASDGLQRARAVVLATNSAKIEFGSQEIDLRDVVDLDAGIKLSQDTVGIDTLLFPQFAKNATISFSSLSLSHPLIVTHPNITGTPITSCTSCIITSKTDTLLIFTVPSFSQYKAVEYSTIYSLSAPDVVTVTGKKGEQLSKNITAANNGMQPVTNIFFLFTPEPGYDANFSHGEKK